jgi:hypothetical protein
MEDLGANRERTAREQAITRLEKGVNPCEEGCANFFVIGSDRERRADFIERYVDNHPTMLGDAISKRPRAAIYLRPEILRVDDISPDSPDWQRNLLITDKLRLALINRLNQACGFKLPKSNDWDLDELDNACETFKKTSKQQPQFVLDQSDGWSDEQSKAINNLVYARSPHYSLVVGVDDFFDGDWPLGQDGNSRPLEVRRNLETVDLNPPQSEWDILAQP